MSYESWRIGFQSSEQAAKAAFSQVEKLGLEIERLKKAKAVSDRRVMDAVAGARKAWAAQGCPEVKALHAADEIRSLADQFSSNPSLYTNSSEVRARLLEHADKLEQSAKQRKDQNND